QVVRVVAHAQVGVLRIIVIAPGRFNIPVCHTDHCTLQFTQSSKTATKLKSFAFSSRASRLRGESPAQDSPRSREERKDFAKKNPFLPAKDFRVSSTDLRSSVFICGFVSAFRGPQALARP